MNLFSTILLVFIALSFANGLSRHRPRRYFPEEDELDNTQFVAGIDSEGNMRYEDLANSPEERGPATSEKEVSFYLYTKENPDYAGSVRSLNFSEIFNNKFFKKNKRIKFLIHGWLNHLGSPSNVVAKKAIFEHHDVNVFVVNWATPANKFYTTSKKAATIVGRITGNFINFLIENFEFSPRDFSLVGFSLGAHAAGFAGRTVKEKWGLVDYIIGLDPAKPLYSVKDSTSRLDVEDAMSVHIIHTNGAFLGFKSSIGDADYYPNGGDKQAGCGWDLFGICSHNRVIDIYAESIKSSGFISHLCDDIKKYDKGHCDNNDDSWMGEFDIDRSADGDYFLRTSDDAPYALGDITRRK